MRRYVALTLIGLWLSDYQARGYSTDHDLSLQKRIDTLEQDITDSQYQEYMEHRVYGDKKPPADRPDDTETGDPQARVDLYDSSEPALHPEAYKAKPQQHPQTGSYETVSMLEESLAPLGDPHDGPPELDPNLKPGEQNPMAHPQPMVEERPRQELLYQQAMHFISQQRPDLAQQHLEELIESFADTPEAVLAHYWTGEILFEKGNHAGASVAYGLAYQAFKGLKPSQRDTAAFHGEEERLPEILLKLASSLKMIGKGNEACVALGQIKKDFKSLPPTLTVLIKNLRSDLKCR